MTRYRWVAKRKAEGFPITMACRVAEVSRQAFYDWRLRLAGGPTEAEQAEAVLVQQMREIHDEFDETYGALRVTVELANQGCVVNHKRVEGLTRAHGIVGIHKPAKVRTTIPAEHNPPLPDLIQRDFTVGHPDVAWVSDITYIPTGQGWLYLATVLDLGSRRLLGYSMNTHMRTSLTTDALDMAAGVRGGLTAGIIFHSDRGSQGGFNWLSQHLECEELRWQGRSVERLIGWCVHRCGLRGDRRGGVVSIRSDPGKVSRMGCRVRKPAWRQGYLLLSGRAGSGRVAGCNRSRLFRCRAVICRSLSVRRPPF